MQCLCDSWASCIICSMLYAIAIGQIKKCTWEDGVWKSWRIVISRDVRRCVVVVIVRCFVCLSVCAVDKSSQVQSTHLRQSDVLRPLRLSALRAYSSRAQVLKYDAFHLWLVLTANSHDRQSLMYYVAQCHYFVYTYHLHGSASADSCIL